jgi:hypothetical protein
MLKRIAALALIVGALAGSEALAQRGERGRRGGRGPRMPMPPVPLMTALDKDGDGTLSAEELASAPQALKTLDKNGDGELTMDEMRPEFGGGRRGGRGGPDVPRQDPADIEFKNGTAALANMDSFHKLAYQGSEVLIDTHLADWEFVKFQIERADTEQPQIYFINTKTHRAHMMFMSSIGLPRKMGGAGQMRGVLVYRSNTKSPNGDYGLFTYEFEPNDSYPFDRILFAYDLLQKHAPILKDRLSYYPMPRAVPRYHDEKALYDASHVPVALDEHLYADIKFQGLHLAEGFGRLRVMSPGELPSPRDVVIYKNLPNEMPRVAGIITEVRQTPLSHVNLRAIQDDVPNAYVAEASTLAEVTALIGKPVYYRVTKQGYELRGATSDALSAHFEAIRPPQPQVPDRDLSLTDIRSLKDLSFEDSTRVGVKAANLAAMGQFGLPDEAVPSGVAVPFHFYDAFMKHNGFYDHARSLLQDDRFLKDAGRREDRLAKFRKAIKKGKMPASMLQALDAAHKSFPEGVSLRCRSSTNNEDLPGFSGAGLYDSFTHHAHEGHLSKSIKQVFASLWNYRAFEEREFYRVDHLVTAMAVLIHESFPEDRANGVAVTDDILYGSYGNYFVNVQLGEDMVTNPQAESTPEEILLDWWQTGRSKVMRHSNRVPDGQRILADADLERMRRYLGKIHSRFSRLYGKSLDEAGWSMEVEFKITKAGTLAIKQARPWVY